MAIRNFAINIDDAVYQDALERANLEGRTLEGVLAELLAEYAGGEPERMVTTYTVKRGDTLARIARQVYGDPHKYLLIHHPVHSQY